MVVQWPSDALMPLPMQHAKRRMWRCMGSDTEVFCPLALKRCTNDMCYLMAVPVDVDPVVIITTYLGYVFAKTQP